MRYHQQPHSHKVNWTSRGTNQRLMWIYWGIKWKRRKKKLSSWVGICWERQFYAGSLSSQYWCLRTGLGPEHILTKRSRVPMDRVGFITLHGISFPVSRFHVFSTVCLSGYRIWYLANPTAIAAPAENRIGSFCYSTKQVCASQLLCIGCLGLAGPGEPLPTTELMLLYPFPTSNPVLSLMTPSQMQWGKVSLNFHSW